MTRHSSGIVVEILGAPASGKSTLAQAMAAVDGVSVVKDHQRGDLPALVRSAVRSWPVVLTAPADVERLRWAAWTGRVSAAPAIARHRLTTGSTMVVFDQGAAYTLVRMAGMRSRRRGNRWWWGRTLRTAQLLDVLIVLDADTDTLAERIRDRGKAHESSRLSAPALHSYLAERRREVHALADVLAREGTDVRRIVSSETTSAEQVALVLEAVSSHPARA